MIALLGSLWPLIGGALLGVGGVIFGLFRHQQAKAATAESETVKAQAAQQVSQIQQAVADQNAVADQRAAQVVQAKEAAQTQAGAVPDADLDSELAKLGGLRK